jgi:hypothetical protein
MHINELSTFFKYLNFGNSIRIDVSSLCQLNCPVCSTWNIRKKVGKGYLKFKDFKNFVDKHPNFKFFKLSNSGEIFLNPGVQFNVCRYSDCTCS